LELGPNAYTAATGGSVALNISAVAIMMMMMISQFGHLGMWVPSSRGARCLHINRVCFHLLGTIVAILCDDLKGAMEDGTMTMMACRPDFA
jgi:hypothetical protein